APGDPASRPRRRASPRPLPLAGRARVRRGGAGGVRRDRRRDPPARRRRGVTALRRTLYPLRLARARLGAGGERLALVGVGIVAGAAVLAAVLAGRLVMQDRSLAETTARLAPADRQ